MPRPTRVQIDPTSLLHNLNQVKQHAPNRKIIAMVKANAYGCGLPAVVPVLDGRVDAFGVACLEEALAIRALGSRSECVIFQGLFNEEEMEAVGHHQFQCVIHQPLQLQWVLANPLKKKIKIWVKVNTGMHRLGFAAHEVHDIINALMHCPWVDEEIGLMTHLACTDEPLQESNNAQLRCYEALHLPQTRLIKSIANSGAILALPDFHADVVRPGIMLYGISPFKGSTGQELGLMPVMRFISAISAIHHYERGSKIGYGGAWQAQRASMIGVVSVGYGDGYPRHIRANTPLWINGDLVPIVGRVSMDSLTVDLTDYSHIKMGDEVELWGVHLPVETIAQAAGTIPYELVCQFSPRIRKY